MVSHDQKDMLHLILIVLTTGGVTDEPSESNDTNACVNGVTSPGSHVVPHFNCLDLINAMAHLTMPASSHNADASANGVT